MFAAERLHEGLATEALVEALLASPGSDPMSLELPEGDRTLLAHILMNVDNVDLEPTPELIEKDIQALREKKHLREREQEVKGPIAEAEHRQDAAALMRLSREKLDRDRALAAGLDPGDASRGRSI